MLHDEWHIHAAEIAGSNVTNHQTNLVTTCWELQARTKGQALGADSFVVGATGPGLELSVGVCGQRAILRERDCVKFQVEVVTTVRHGFPGKCPRIHHEVDEIFVCNVRRGWEFSR